MTSYLITFLAGALTGASGKYLADKFTDQRRRQEGKSEAQNIFDSVEKQIPELIKEIKEDFKKLDCSLMREFYILPNDRVIFNSDGKMCLFYYEDRHNHLLQKIKILENNGYVYDVTETNTPKYRITEEFATFLLK